MQKFTIVLVLLIFCCATIRCQPLHCSSSSDHSSRDVFYPNILDIHFVPSTASRYEHSGNQQAQFYTIPFSPSGRNCSGNVTAIKYCFKIFNTELDRKIRIFQLILGTRNASLFNVTRKININSRLRNSICTRVLKVGNRKYRVCCDTFELQDNQQFLLPASQFTYGINLFGPRVILSTINVSWFKRNKVNHLGQFNFPTMNRFGPMLLLRFSIDSNELFTPSSFSSDAEKMTTSRITGYINNRENSSGALIGGILVVLFGIALALVAVCVVLVWLHFRRKKAVRSFRVQREFSNAVYDEVDLETLDKEYADIGPAVFSSKEQKLQPKDNEHSYAEWGASQGAAYEEPVMLVKGDHDMKVTKDNKVDEEDIYVDPPRNEDALYSQLDGISQSLKRENVSLGDSLGSGQFGTVHQGIWRCGQEEVQVAVKTLKEGAKEEDRVKFLQEAAIMGQFKHPNVVTMYGVVKQREPVRCLNDKL